MSAIKKPATVGKPRKPKLQEHPAAKQTWLRHGEHGAVRIMGTVEGYVVFRRPGASPRLATLREFLRDFVRCT